MKKVRRRENLAERNDPGDPEPESCSPGSIEQQLDMCERGSLRGDQILHNHGVDEDEESLPDSDRGLDRILNQYYEVDLAEESREGDEMSGDEHSSGLQGGDSELRGQFNVDNGLPGDRTERMEVIENLEEEEREGQSIVQPRSKPPRVRHLRRLK